jgi:hypothetical protein
LLFFSISGPLALAAHAREAVQIWRDCAEIGPEEVEFLRSTLWHETGGRCFPER